MANPLPQDRTTAPYVVGMDLGGTKILAAAVDARGRILAEAKRGTSAQEGPDAVIERMAKTARRAARQAGIAWSAVAGIRWNQVAGVGVGAEEGILELLEVQLAGKTAMDVHAFGQDRRDFAGSLLGGPSS